MKEKTFFGQPMGLLSVFSTGICERFSFYTMRAMLFLFLTAAFATGGFGMDRMEAMSIYGIYLGLVYVTPIIGGILADKWLGQKICTYVGALLMAVGQLSLAISAMFYAQEAFSPEVMALKKYLLYAGLGLLIMGNGFFKPNVTAMVGAVYPENDARRDVGFTIFYMGINIGAFIAPFASGFFGEQIGWKYGFLASVVGMFICLIVFYVSRTTTAGIGLPPKHPQGAMQLVRKDWFTILYWTLGVVALILLIVFLLMYVPENIMNVAYWVLGLGVAAYILSSVVKGTSGATQWSRVGVIFALAVFNIAFFAGFEQAGTTFTEFANVRTDRGFIPASLFQSINPLFVILLGPVFSLLWTFLDKRKANPNTPMKFAISLLLLAGSFFIMAYAYNLTLGPDGEIVKVSAAWLLAVYCIQTCAELCMSPVGLSMVTKLSPAGIVNVLMGLWMGSIAIGNFMAQQMEKVAQAIAPSMQSFEFIAWQSLVAGALLMLLSPLLFRAMKGVQ